MQVKCKILRAHTLGKTKQFVVVQDRDVIDVTELLLDLYLTTVKLATEWTDFSNCVAPASLTLSSSHW